MRKAKAIAIVRENSFVLAAESAKYACKQIIHFMYGTPARTRLTLWFSFGLALLGVALVVQDANALAVCAV